jgi:hypothetical protein
MLIVSYAMPDKKSLHRIQTAHKLGRIMTIMDSVILVVAMVMFCLILTLEYQTRPDDRDNLYASHMLTSTTITVESFVTMKIILTNKTTKIMRPIV